MDEVREAAQEWNHLCLMKRLVKYLSDYYDVPLSVTPTAEASLPNLQGFYNTYRLPFCFVVEWAYNCEPEQLVDCPDQVFLFLSSLAHSYETDESLHDLPEEEAFTLIFRERDALAQARDDFESTLVKLGMFVQSSDTLVVGDPSVPKDEDSLCTIPKVERGMWSAAVLDVARCSSPEEQKVSFLLAKSMSCSYSFQQILEQVFFWKTVPFRVVAMNGVVGLFDLKSYQDPTVFGHAPLTKDAGDIWAKACVNATYDYPYAGILPHGVISCSGEGEGAYDVYYLCNSSGSVVAVVVDYLLYGEL